MKIKLIESSLLLFMIATSVRVYAQVGINNANAHPSTVLDLAGGDNTNAGLLIPQVRSDTVGGKSLVKTPRANGLLVFDSINSQFFFWQESDASWYALNAWQANSANNTTYTLNDSVGIGTANPTEKLDVTGNINTSGKIQENGNDLIAQGIITMWSGSADSIPAGWAICDGNNGTPDLRGRFVVGYDSADVDYDNVGELGPVHTDADGAYSGESTEEAKQIRLAMSQSGIEVNSLYYTQDPPTQLNLSNIDSTKRMYNIYLDMHNYQNGDWYRFRGSTGKVARTAHENRPPFYVLAYIMKQ